ncbi:MAG: hypothetical protein U9R21_06700 [Candidatus Thermoplasmatota archaeon]|nr:hypothetical protein [Candidatus Thermoplasmatota archaeon]
MREGVEALIKKNVVIKIPHKHGDKVFINPTYKSEIKRELKKIYPFI